MITLRQFYCVFALSIIGCLFLIGCGSEEKPKESRLATGVLRADSFLPGSLPGIALQRFTVKDGESELEGYVGSAAESYYDYGLIGLVAALYEAGGTTISVEIAQFTDPLHAYGFYATTRPAGAELTGLGTESYQTGNSYYFVQNEFSVTISAFQDSINVSDQILRLALTISTEIGEAQGVPEVFSLLPEQGLVSATRRFFPKSYLGISKLDDVCDGRFAFGADTVTLFLCSDQAGAKYLAVAETITDDNRLPPPAGVSGFDADYVQNFADPDYGRVMVGLVQGWLVGVVGYSEGTTEELNAWVSAVAASDELP